MENEILMPIGGGNLPIDVAPVPIELNQVQVDHAIAKMTEQKEEEAAAKCAIDKDNANPAENIPQPVPAVVADDQPMGSKSTGDANAKVSSPPVKGEFKTITHALKKKLRLNVHTSVMCVEPGNLAYTY